DEDGVVVRAVLPELLRLALGAADDHVVDAAAGGGDDPGADRLGQRPRGVSAAVPASAGADVLVAADDDGPGVAGGVGERDVLLGERCATVGPAGAGAVDVDGGEPLDGDHGVGAAR